MWFKGCFACSAAGLLCTVVPTYQVLLFHPFHFPLVPTAYFSVFQISPPFTIPTTYFFFLKKFPLLLHCLVHTFSFIFPPPFTVPTSYFSFTFPLLFAVPTTYFSLIFPLLLQYPPRTFSFIFLLLLQYLPHLYLSFSPFFYSTYQSLLFQILSFFTVATQDFWSHFIFSHFYSVYQHWSVLSFFKYPDRQVLWFWGVFFYHHTGYQKMWI